MHQHVGQVLRHPRAVAGYRAGVVVAFAAWLLWDERVLRRGVKGGERGEATCVCHDVVCHCIPFLCDDSSCLRPVTTLCVSVIATAKRRLIDMVSV